jgi:rare lipoprotein A
MNSLTAAHPTLPFNTKVRVNNTQNGKSVVVRINDRGPFKDNRIMDLSLSAAKTIGLIGPGTAWVKLEILEIGSESR